MPSEPKPPPKCKAILLCDMFIIDAQTGKATIVGIFDNFILPRFPHVTAPFTVFVQMIDGVGDYRITLEIQDLQTNTIIARADGPEVRFPDRMTKVNFKAAVPPIPLPHEGRYDFVVLANGQEIDRQQFAAILMEGGSDAANPES